MSTQEARSSASKQGWMARETAQRRSRASARQPPIQYRILQTALLCLLATGAVFVYSASSPRSLVPGQGSGASFLIRFIIAGAIGLAAMSWLMRGKIDRVRQFTGALLVAAFVLLVAVRLPGIGRSVGSAHRWLGAGPIEFQPSELMKLALVLYAAHVLASRPRAAVKPLLVVTGAACVLVAVQPDLGTALVLAFTLAAVLIAAGTPMQLMLRVGGAALALVVVFAMVVPYANSRLTSFINPWAHAGTTGFQAVQGQIAFGSGGLFGVGPGQSVQKVFYLPEANTDFILAVIGEEGGALGVCALLFLYGLIAYAGLWAAKHARTTYASLVAVGMTTLVVGQAALNAFAVLGLAPLTGVPLPFVSYGSSNLVVMLAAMGLLMNVAAGATGHLRALGTPTAKQRRSKNGGPTSDRDRGGRDGRARGAGAGRRRRAAG